MQSKTNKLLFLWLCFWEATMNSETEYKYTEVCENRGLDLSLTRQQ